MDMDVQSTLYRRNLLWQQVEARRHTFEAVRSLLAGKRGYRHEHLLTALALAVFLSDLLLGAVVSVLWTRYHVGSLLEDAVTRYTLSNLRVTRELLAWVMGSPAGLKLNSPLRFVGIAGRASMPFIG